MKQKALLFGVGTVIGAIIILIVVLFFNAKTAVAPQQVACTQEAKICPDGSSVGRVGPSCAFAPCPPVATSTQNKTLDADQTKLNRTITLNGVSITPLVVDEDSRCPSDVRCVQAGTVQITALLASGTLQEHVSISMDTPVLFEGKDITLQKVAPLASSEKAITSDGYIFTFFVQDHVSVATGTLQGTIDISPACSTQEVDGTCTPNAEMYTSKQIGIYSDSAESQLVATTTPNAQGRFSIVLKIGSYYVDLIKRSQAGETVTGLPTHVVINDGATVTIPISVDTAVQ